MASRSGAATRPTNLIDALFREPPDSSAFCDRAAAPSSPAPAATGMIPYQSFFEQCGAEWGVPWQILAGLASTESGTPGQPQAGFNPGAVSDTGQAYGIMQVIADRGSNPPKFSNPFPGAIKNWPLANGNWQDPESNICAGAAKLAHFYHVQGTWTRALLKYKGASPNSSESAPYEGTTVGVVVGNIFSAATSLGGGSWAWGS